MAAKIDLTKYGITGTTEIVYNPSYEMLFEEETKPELEGYEKGQVSELGAVNVMTGIYTGRSPKDKFIVVDENSTLVSILISRFISFRAIPRSLSLDTTKYTKMHRQLAAKSIVINHSLKFIDAHRKELKSQYKDFDSAVIFISSGVITGARMVEAQVIPTEKATSP